MKRKDIDNIIPYIKKLEEDTDNRILHFNTKGLCSDNNTKKKGEDTNNKYRNILLCINNK